MVSRFIAKYPIVKTMGAYFCINVAADFNEQTLIKKRTKETYDRGKTARIAATCTFVTSPMLFVWIRFIDKFIPGKTALTVLKKVLADACIFAPTVISTFYITTNVLERKEDLTAEWKQKFYPTWTTGLCYWPFVQAVNFAVIPMKYKTCLYMPTASFIWMNYLCYMKDQVVIHSEDKEIQTAQDSHTQKLVPNTSLPNHFVHNKDLKTICDRSSYCSETCKLEESAPRSVQSSAVCSVCHKTDRSETTVVQSPRLQSFPDLLMS